MRGRDFTIAEGGRRVPILTRIGGPNTRRAYVGVLDRVATELGPGRPLGAVPGDEVAGALHRLWGESAPATWNRNRADVASWLIWCAQKKRWPAPQLPPDAERARRADAVAPRHPAAGEGAVADALRDRRPRQ